MAIVQSVLDLAFAEAAKHSGARVRKIKLTVGEMSGVVPQAAEFAFTVLTEDTIAAGAELEIEVVELTAQCGNCGRKRMSISDLRLKCDGCGGQMSIASGRELRVEYIDID